MTPEERYWSKVEIRGLDECWPWKLHCLKTGYGVGMYRGKQTTAHRHAYAIHNGLDHLPSDVEVLHSCDNPPCCNPAHLTAGSHAENMQDCAEKGRLYVQQNRPSHCKRNHPFDEANTWVTKEGWHQCRTCHRNRQRVRRSRSGSR